MIVNALELCKVTREEVDKCFRVIDENGDVFYRVESRTHENTDYTVRKITISGKSRTTCSCPAGNPPIGPDGMPLYPPVNCWHKRAAVAHAMEWNALKQAETIEMAAVQVKMEVISRREYKGCVAFEVRTGEGEQAQFDLVGLHPNGQYLCACNFSVTGALSAECKHAQVARQFEEQFHQEMAAHIQSL